MQDKFKFRYFDKDTKAIYTLKPIKNTCENGKDIVFYGILVSGEGLISDYDLDNAYSPRFVKMQCTGLKDKNGKLIYEGDIIRIPDDWDTYGMMAGEEREVYYNEGFRLKPLWNKKARGNWLEDTKRLEVIGNIYENP